MALFFEYDVCLLITTVDLQLRVLFLLRCLHTSRSSSEGMCQVGVCYINGNYVKTDYSEALKWFRKALNQDVVSTSAYYYLGMCYNEGFGVSKNHTEAVKYFRKSAELDYDRAQYNLGVSYLKGIGVAKNQNEAIRWLKMAAEQGNEEAKDALKKLNVRY